MSIIDLFFSWPNGTVWSNIIASVMWSLPTVGFTFWRIRKHQRKNHREVMANVDELHQKIDGTQDVANNDLMI
jgi:hypothetical protein